MRSNETVGEVGRFTLRGDDSVSIVAAEIATPADCRVAIPRAIRPDVQTRLERFAQPIPEGLLFVGDRNGRPRRQNFLSLWIKAQIDAGGTPVHFHDLRHSGNMLAAAEGATLRELMDRMGHTSPAQ